MVKPNEEKCPGCGRFFRAVKCPVCSYSGKGADFLKGCPSCGYLSTNKNTGPNPLPDKKSKNEFLKISKLFAYISLVLLSVVLIYLIYYLFKK